MVESQSYETDKSSIGREIREVMMATFMGGWRSNKGKQSENQEGFFYLDLDGGYSLKINLATPN